MGQCTSNGAMLLSLFLAAAAAAGDSGVPGPPAPGPLLQAALRGPLAGVDQIVYAERTAAFDHWYGNFGYYSASVPEYPPQRGLPNEAIPPLFGQGGRLCLFHLRTGRRTILLEDRTGGVRDPVVSYDGKTILFSYREGGQPYYRLYEMGIDDRHLRQITHGSYDDIEPCYLPDGGIMFSSSRANRFVNCYRTPVATLYRCQADGSDVQMLSANVEHDNTPWVLPDGRVLYMRWEYVDRSQFCFHHLWTTNPDGTAQNVFYGNQFPEFAMLDAKPIPGTGKVVASFSPGHGKPDHMGRITIVDPSTGPDNSVAARPISPKGPYFRDPFPMSEDCYFVADAKGIHLMDQTGQTELIVAPAADELRLECHEPRPIAAHRREPIVPARVDRRDGSGRLLLSNVYHGRNMAGVKPGDIKTLLVLEQLPKPINFSGGMWPTSDGGTFTLSRILGTVPVAADGSAYFELPARRPVYFVALDQNDLSVKRMQSFTSVQPGETIGCVGCHEARTESPPAPISVAAMRRPPSTIKPVSGVPDVLDFPRHIQPILDRHCVACHDAIERAGGVDLCGDHTPLFSQSYITITRLGLVADGRNERYGNRPPRSIGSSASRLMQYIDGQHYGARLDPLEQSTVRLWIEASGVYAGTYAALGSGMVPVEYPRDVVERRCGGCHGAQAATATPIGPSKTYYRFGPRGPYVPLVHAFGDLQKIRGSIGYYKSGDALPPQALANLTHPEHSVILRAPLSKRSGGLGLCGGGVFSDTADADYRELLSAVEAAARLHAAEGRYDMPGFRPNVYYIRQMQRYGMLPPVLDDDAPIDVFALDEAYWRSFWYQGSAEVASSQYEDNTK